VHVYIITSDGYIF